MHPRARVAAQNDRAAAALRAASQHSSEGSTIYWLPRCRRCAVLVILLVLVWMIGWISVFIPVFIHPAPVDPLSDATFCINNNHRPLRFNHP
eukprot:4358618-Pleurochrysis_carterae.AAC.1